MYNIFFPLNSVIKCYVFVQLIKFIYIFICICFVSNTFLLKVSLKLNKTSISKRKRFSLYSCLE